MFSSVQFPPVPRMAHRAEVIVLHFCLSFANSSRSCIFTPTAVISFSIVQCDHEKFGVEERQDMGKLEWKRGRTWESWSGREAGHGKVGVEERQDMGKLEWKRGRTWESWSGREADHHQERRYKTVWQHAMKEHLYQKLLVVHETEDWRHMMINATQLEL
ncbi:hypothetical protein BsWGS_00651 [Bradybaena similaris]